MRERPIPFKAHEVRAILDGRKTQTRRPVKPQPKIFVDHDGRATWRHGKRIGSGPHADAWTWHAVDRCPLGQPGERLWVRETCRQAYPITPYSNGIVYRADAPRALGMGEYSSRHKWTPSIHMPRWASRITLEITDVRVQRVQDIGEADALAEGITHSTLNDPCVEFHWLWNDTYGPDAWDRNDWVWAVSFKRIEVPHG